MTTQPLIKRMEDMEDNFDKLYSIVMKRLDDLEEMLNNHVTEHKDTAHRY